jgi:hypothetical protein
MSDVFVSPTLINRVLFSSVSPSSSSGKIYGRRIYFQGEKKIKSFHVFQLVVDDGDSASLHGLEFLGFFSNKENDTFSSSSEFKKKFLNKENSCQNYGLWLHGEVESKRYLRQNMQY